MKKHLLTPCLILFVFLFSFAHSRDLFNSVFYSELLSKQMDQSQLHYGIDHIEILRESRNDTLLSRYTIRRQFVDYTQCFKTFGINLNYSRNILRFTDIINSAYTHSDFIPITHRFTANTKFSVGKTHYNPGIDITYSRAQDTLFIDDYPKSETKIYNDYFFNLLPSTFGDSILFNNTYFKFASSIYVDKLQKDKGFSFYALFSFLENKCYENHENTGDFEKLRGPRTSLVIGNAFKIKSTLSLKTNTTTLIDLGVSYRWAPLNWSHTIFPNNPDTLEIIQLSETKFNAFSCKLAYNYSYESKHFMLALKLGKINGDAHISTPVLGYIFGLLPIAHQGDLNITSSFTELISHFSYPLIFDFITICPRMDLLSGFYSSNINVQALLQFGIEDIDIAEHYQHVALLASPGITSKIYLNSELYMDLDISQLIPIIKQLSPEPEPIQDSDIKRYGGLSISLGVGMNW